MKQQVAKKRKKLCSDIIGKPVFNAFMNGNLPNGVALAWTGPRDAYLVNLRKRTAKEYVRNGTFLMKRAFLPIMVYEEFNQGRITKSVEGRRIESNPSDGDTSGVQSRFEAIGDNLDAGLSD